MEHIALDARGPRSYASIENCDNGCVTEARIEHRPGAIAEFLGKRCPELSVALETVGKWYWIAGAVKTDRLDARGLNRLQRFGTLPAVWVSSEEVRDTRSLARTRMAFSWQRSRCRHQIQANLVRHGLRMLGSGSPFNKKGWRELETCLHRLSRLTTEQLLEHLDSFCAGIQKVDNGIEALFAGDWRMGLLRTVPSIGLCWAASRFREPAEN